jgi:hypothetical protein
MLVQARDRGFSPEQVLRTLHDLVQPKCYPRIVLVEANAPMAEILCQELRDQVGDVICCSNVGELGKYVGGRSLFVALPTRIAAVRPALAPEETLLPLRIRSISELLEGEKKPSAQTIVAVISRSEEFRTTASAVLVAVGIPSLCICEVDPSDPSWRERVPAAATTIVDAVVARELDGRLAVRAFRIISDECLAHLRELTKPL